MSSSFFTECMHEWAAAGGAASKMARRRDSTSQHPRDPIDPSPGSCRGLGGEGQPLTPPPVSPPPSAKPETSVPCLDPTCRRAWRRCPRCTSSWTASTCRALASASSSASTLRCTSRPGKITSAWCALSARRCRLPRCGVEGCGGCMACMQCSPVVRSSRCGVEKGVECAWCAAVLAGAGRQVWGEAGCGGVSGVRSEDRSLVQVAQVWGKAGCGGARGVHTEERTLIL
eukprot:360037-Chlamydomonas_euryale.AAC.3